MAAWRNAVVPHVEVVLASVPVLLTPLQQGAFDGVVEEVVQVPWPVSGGFWSGAAVGLVSLLYFCYADLRCAMHQDVGEEYLVCDARLLCSKYELELRL